MENSKQRGRPREFDVDAALECAMRLFWERGFEATAISDLTSAMGITPPALYGAFGDKKSLFLRAIELYQRGPGGFAAKALTKEPTAKKAIRRLLKGALESFTTPGNPSGCLVVLGAANCASPDIAAALAGYRRMAEDAVRARIEAGRNAGELPEDADIEALAGMVTATLYGLAVMAKDGAKREILQRIVKQAMRGWPRPAP